LRLINLSWQVYERASWESWLGKALARQAASTPALTTKKAAFRQPLFVGGGGGIDHDHPWS
jgi:hypothetical protein